ncbi:hypothetical protein [Methylobacterium durans]|nr:hypothetical protein [Methylobacterium durans]
MRHFLEWHAKIPLSAWVIVLVAEALAYGVVVIAIYAAVTASLQ